MVKINTASKVSVFGVFLVRIFPHLRISSYSVRIRENTDKKNSEYGHFLRSEISKSFQNIVLGQGGQKITNSIICDIVRSLLL